ncbi:MAG TPA: AMP-binding protein [Opitutaceae bacterium]|nr:AMP-binding protein [Opitutaceae bacterium]
MDSSLAMIEEALTMPAVRSAQGGDWRAHAANCRKYLDASAPPPLRVWVADSEPVRFFAAAFTALARGDHVFLANHRWSATDWEAALEIAQPEVFFSHDGSERHLRPPGDGPLFGDGRMMIATGGTSGRMRFAIHTADSLFAAADALRVHFGTRVVSSVCVLPVHHIGGVQQVVRAIASGGEVLCADWKSVEGGAFPEVGPNWTISLVPAQLHRLVNSAPARRWLREFRAVMVGGGPAGTHLLASARDAQIPVSVVYGSTETAALVAALKPAEFLAGARNCGHALPHAVIRIADLDTGLECSAGEPGRIIIKSASLYEGYWPRPEHILVLATEDIGVLDDLGRLTVIGRADAVINSGGEKIHPAEVEAAIRATGQLQDVVVAGAPDPEWGETVAALYPSAAEPDIAALESALRASLGSIKLPRLWVPIADWPVNDAGKVNRALLRELLMEH